MSEIRNGHSDVEIAIEMMPEPKRTFARSWWEYLKNGQVTVAIDFALPQQAVEDVREELAMYDIKTGKKVF